jgi:hypothetical protein
LGGTWSWSTDKALRKLARDLDIDTLEQPWQGKVCGSSGAQREAKFGTCVKLGSEATRTHRFVGPRELLQYAGFARQRRDKNPRFYCPLPCLPSWAPSLHLRVLESSEQASHRLGAQTTVEETRSSLPPAALVLKALASDTGRTPSLRTSVIRPPPPREVRGDPRTIDPVRVITAINSPTPTGESPAGPGAVRFLDGGAAQIPSRLVTEIEELRAGNKVKCKCKPNGFVERLQRERGGAFVSPNFFAILLRSDAASPRQPPALTLSFRSDHPRLCARFARTQGS